MTVNKKRRIAVFIFAVILISAVLSFVGALSLGEKSASFIFSIFVCASLLCGTAAFEGSRMSVIKISLISVMTALSVCGRVIFYPVAFFKPVSAVVILCGIYLGPVAGMICGAMSAVVSGVFFGYGLWLPFQVFAWGLIGLLSGLLRRPLEKSRITLCLFGALSGVIFSVFMDAFTVLSFGNGFELSMYAAALVSALPVTAVYAVSNVIFLLALARPVGKKLERVL